MKIVKLREGDTYTPETDWKRVSLAGSKQVSIEYFEKPPGHSSPMHCHPSEQVSIVLKGHMQVRTADGESAVLDHGDSAWFAPNEEHCIENVGEHGAIGIDIFTPARPFDFWKKKR